MVARANRLTNYAGKAKLKPAGSRIRRGIKMGNKKKYLEEKKQMHKISSYAGRPEYVQGGGGNTSVKFDDRLMAIKASGYTLKEITEEKGYVTVDYTKIRRYYDSVQKEAGKDYEKESLQVNLSSIALLPGMEEKRPSVEVGFHSFLSKNVIHTHSVYANILCCSEEGRDAAQKIFEQSGIGYVFLPYIDPGFTLTLTIKKEIGAYQKEKGCMPDVLFLDNHGVIVHNDDVNKVIEIHEAVNEKIKNYFNLKDFKAPSVQESGDGFVGGTPLLKEFIIQNKAGEDYWNALQLYPDQLVYTGGRIGSQIKIDDQTGEVYYQAGERESQTIEETLAGVAYVIKSVADAELTLRQMNEAGARFINNWESEKYRSKLVK